MALRALLALGLLAATLAFASTAAAAKAAGTAAAAEAGIELVAGSGRANLSLRGAALGRVARGWVAIRERPGREEVEIHVQGHDWERRLANGSIVYGGERIRFRVFRGAWQVRIEGQGINVSAVGRGTVGLRGAGRYALAGGPYQRWPSSYRTIRLG